MAGNVVIVNEKDEVIGSKAREDCGPGDITRVSSLFLYTPTRHVVIAKRSMQKLHDPGRWSLAVAGTVEPGESYLENILRETQEEIGLMLQPEDVQMAWYGLYEDRHKFFYTLYTAQQHIDLTLLRRQVEEVDELRLVSREELFRWVENHPEDFVFNIEKTISLVRQALKW